MWHLPESSSLLPGGAQRCVLVFRVSFVCSFSPNADTVFGSSRSSLHLCASRVSYYVSYYAPVPSA